jgi:putative SOS response-associated peptidase YedK
MYNAFMCVNYAPTQKDRIAKHFDAMVKDLPQEREVFPGYSAPIVAKKRRGEGKGTRVCASACFGMVPAWSDLQMFKNTYNARSETVMEKASFRNAWQNAQFCIVPADAIFEPNYESGKAERWAIRHADDKPLGIAAIWDWRPDGPGGKPLLSFSMLTINADEHPLMKRFHKPGEEKRSVVMLEQNDFEAWLESSPLEAGALLKPYPAEKLTALVALDEIEQDTRQADLFSA